MSKVMERIVAKEILSHLEQNDLLPAYQSGYRKYHSTETALLEILSTLFAATDSKNISLLALLDMSAAFDCVDHGILLDRLDNDYGVSGVVKLWFESYLSNRTQQVLFNGKLSDIQIVTSGVPQGSVLGPILFLLYSADVLKIINSFGFHGHAYADDVQIIISGLPTEFPIILDKFTSCLSDIGVWMSDNRLKLNQSKTQLLPIGTWQQLSKIKIDSVILANQIINFSSKAVNLGCILDSQLTFLDHIKFLTRTCLNQLRKLKIIRKSLQKDTAQSLIHAFIHARLDYCNSLFYGLPDKSIYLLQLIQNRAAKIVVQALKFDFVSPILEELHWLKVEKRIVYKVSILMFKIVNGLAPKYLMNRCTPKSTVLKPRYLRSDQQNFMIVPDSRLKIGERNFSVFGPRVWNSLPNNLRHPGLSFEMFKKLLKTYLFVH